MPNHYKIRAVLTRARVKYEVDEERQGGLGATKTTYIYTEVSSSIEPLEYSA